MNKSEYKGDSPGGQPATSNQKRVFELVGKGLSAVFLKKNIVFAFVHRTAVTRQMALPSNIQIDEQKRTQQALPQQDSHFCKQSNGFGWLWKGAIRYF